MTGASVIIPVYNGEQFINKAIHSALSQTFSDIEIIIIDDASVDRTRDTIFNKYGDLIGNKIMYFRNNQNRERAFSRNKGHELSTGDYIFFLDSDDEWERDYVEETLNYFGKTHCDVTYTFQRTFIDRKSTEIKVSKKTMPEDIGEIICSSAVGYPTATAFKKTSFAGYDTGYIPREDWEIFIRAYLNGLKIGILDNNKVKIRSHRNRTSRSVSFWSSTIKIYNDYRKNIPDDYKCYFLFHLGEVCLRFGDIGKGWGFIIQSIKAKPGLLQDRRRVSSIIKRGFRVDKYLRYLKERSVLSKELI